MAIYKGKDIDLLIDLINESNPTLPFPLDNVNFLYGVPKVIAGAAADEDNTSIRVQAKSSSKYRGTVDLTYRRIDLSVLFRGIPIQIHRWWAGTCYMKQLVPLINERYGINLHEDFGNGPGWGVANSGTSRILTQNANNYFYTGSCTVFLHMDLEELGLDVMTVTDIDAIQWPGGNDFTQDRRNQLEFMFTDIDFSEYTGVNGDGFIVYGDFDKIRAARPDLDFYQDPAFRSDTNAMFSTVRSNVSTVAEENKLFTDLRTIWAIAPGPVPLISHGFNRVSRMTAYQNRIKLVASYEEDGVTPKEFLPIVGNGIIRYNNLT